MNNKNSQNLAGVIDMLIESSNRINEAKPQKYWYPLSMATYGTEEIVEAIDSMCAFRTTMWEKTRDFEEKFSRYQNCEASVMVNSGSSADLLLCFLLKDLTDDRDEILVPAVTWPTQIWSAIMAGFKVVLVDVDPKTLNINYQDLESKITSKSRAIFVVHLMGNPCDMNTIVSLAIKHNLAIIEDCCEALGAEFDGKKVGNFGIGGTYSFFFSHHITTMEGGIIVCSNKEIAEKLKILRAHGWTRNIDIDSPFEGIDPRYTFVNWGFNVRPTELQAGFGLHQLDRLPIFNSQRKLLADKFFSFIKQTEWLEYPIVANLATPSWLGLPLIIKKRSPFSVKEITEYLESNGIETRPIVTGNIAKHPVASKFGLVGNYPGADAVHKFGFYIGLSPMQTSDTMDKLILCFKDFLKRF